LYKLVYLEWEDASYVANQYAPEAIDDDPFIVKTIGWLVKETRQRFHLACEEHVTTGQVKHILSIPKNYVRRKKILNIKL